MRTIAIDFDGTLFFEADDGLLYPYDGAREAMINFKNAGYRLVIHTCRIGIAAEDGRLKDEVQLIQSLLEAHDVPFDEIYMGPKMVADVYIDDRAVGFQDDWEAAQTETFRKLGVPKWSESA